MATVRQAFDEDGYFHARAVFSADELVAMERDFDRIVKQLQASGEDIDGTWSGSNIAKHRRTGDTIWHTHNVQNYSATWLQAIQQPAFLDLAQEILGESIVLHHSKLFCKPGGKGSPFPIHQDWSYFPTEKDTMIAAIIHVSDADDSMGCLRVYPGSHKLGRVEGSSGQQPCEVLKDYPLENATIVEARAGDVVFFHYFTLHGSMPNQSEQDRKTVLVQMHAGTDKVVTGNDHPNAQLTLRGWNSHAARDSAGEI